MQTAVIIGSTGLIGSLLVEKLVQTGEFEQIIALYRGETPTSLYYKSPKVHLIRFDFQNWSELELQIKAKLNGPSFFFCCLGSTIKKAKTKENFKKVDLDAPVQFAQLSKDCSGEMLLVVSAAGADEHSQVFYNQTKGEMEKSVRATFSNQLHFFRPSLLLGDRKEFRIGERLAVLAAPLYAPFMFGKLKSFRPVKAASVVNAMYAVATRRLCFDEVVENFVLLRL
ncbi:MAG: NAD-dependent epimerase/dehydratase family protein [Bacteriovoracia bacterium]